MSRVKNTIINELHRPARRRFPRSRTIIKGLDDLWQADLAEFQPFARDNKGHKYVLVIIDCFSKFLWLRPLKDKSGLNVSRAMASVLEEGRVPKHLCADLGKEFYNRSFSDLMKRYGVNHYSTYSIMKASIAERVIRTIKDYMYKMFSLEGSYKYLSKLPYIAREYNSRKHRTIGMAPKDVNKSNEKELLDAVYTYVKLRSKPIFKVGDTVRISKHKTVFAKGYMPNWSTELFKITQVNTETPVTYLLKDTSNAPILGRFYQEELRKAKYEDVYLVEKILKTRGDKVYVRWLGFDSTHDSWINKSNVL